MMPQPCVTRSQISPAFQVGRITHSLRSLSVTVTLAEQPSYLIVNSPTVHTNYHWGGLECSVPNKEGNERKKVKYLLHFTGTWWCVRRVYFLSSSGQPSQLLLCSDRKFQYVFITPVM